MSAPDVLAAALRDYELGDRPVDEKREVYRRGKAARILAALEAAGWRLVPAEQLRANAVDAQGNEYYDPDPSGTALPSPPSSGLREALAYADPARTGQRSWIHLHQALTRLVSAIETPIETGRAIHTPGEKEKWIVRDALEQAHAALADVGVPHKADSRLRAALLSLRVILEPMTRMDARRDDILGLIDRAIAAPDTERRIDVPHNHDGGEHCFPSRCPAYREPERRNVEGLARAIRSGLIGGMTPEEIAAAYEAES